MGKKKVNCTGCGSRHYRPGGSLCKNVVAARDLCREKGEEESEFEKYLNQDKIDTEHLRPSPAVPVSGTAAQRKMRSLREAFGDTYMNIVHTKILGNYLSEEYSLQDGRGYSGPTAIFNNTVSIILTLSSTKSPKDSLPERVAHAQRDLSTGVDQWHIENIIYKVIQSEERNPADIIPPETETEPRPHSTHGETRPLEDYLHDAKKKREKMKYHVVRALDGLEYDKGNRFFKVRDPSTSDIPELRWDLRLPFTEGMTDGIAKNFFHSFISEAISVAEKYLKEKSERPIVSVSNTNAYTFNAAYVKDLEEDTIASKEPCEKATLDPDGLVYSYNSVDKVFKYYIVAEFKSSRDMGKLGGKVQAMKYACCALNTQDTVYTIRMNPVCFALHCVKKEGAQIVYDRVFVLDTYTRKNKANDAGICAFFDACVIAIMKMRDVQARPTVGCQQNGVSQSTPTPPNPEPLKGPITRSRSKNPLSPQPRRKERAKKK